MKNTRALAVLNFIVLIVHIVLSYATQMKYINPLDVGEVSNQYNSLFTPAPITFAIWGVIYTALFLFATYHLIIAMREPATHPANVDTWRIGGLFIANNLATIGWLIAWTYNQMLVSLILIGIQLITLIAIHLRMGIHDPHRSIASKIFTQFPLSIYFAWISIATIANASIYLVSIGWNGIGPGYSANQWTIIMISVAVFITMLVIFTRRNVFFGLVVMWALYGIILKRTEVDAADYHDIIRAAWIGIGVTALCSVIQLVRNFSARRPHVPFPASPHPIK